MRPVESPPDITRTYSDAERMNNFFSQLNAPRLKKLIMTANEQYLHWDELRYKPIPDGISHEDVWAYLKIIRGGSVKVLPFKDKNEQPFTYWIPEGMLKTLSEIDRWSGETIITSNPTALPSREQYIISSLMEEAIASSQLEGASTTRKVAKEMLRSGRKPRNKHEKMILNNWLAVQYIRENKQEKLTPERVFELHRIMTEGTLDDPMESGRLRTTDDINVIYDDQVVHIPPKAETLKERLDLLCDFANNDDGRNWIHPVIKGAMIHFCLAYDHPFSDGNGRTARALLYWYIFSRGYALFEYLAISRCFVRAPSKYMHSYLYTETDDGDLTYFLNYNLRAIRFAIREVKKYLQEKVAEITRFNEILRNYRGLNIRERALISSAIRHPNEIYTIETHKNYHQIVYETARRDLLHLTKKGLLKMDKRGREYVFTPSSSILEKLHLDNLKTG